MSENKEVKKAEQGFFARAKDWCIALPGRIKGAFKNMVAELKKVVVALAVIVGLLDTASSFLVKQLMAL